MRIVLNSLVVANDADRFDTRRQSKARIGCDGHVRRGAVAVVFVEEVQPNLFGAEGGSEAGEKEDPCEHV